MIIFFMYLILGIFTNLIELWWSWYINLIVFLINLIHGELLQMRYDELYLCWKIILPFKFYNFYFDIQDYICIYVGRD